MLKTSCWKRGRWLVVVGLVALLLNFGLIAVIKYFVDDNLEQLEKTLSRSNMMLVHSKVQTDGWFFWDLEMSVRYLRISGSVIGRQISLSLDSIKFKLQVFDKQIKFGEMPRLSFWYFSEDKPPAETTFNFMVSDEQGAAAAAGVAAADGSAQQEKSVIEFFFREPLYKLVSKSLLQLFSGGKLYFVKLDNPRKGGSLIFLEGLKVVIDDFKFESYFELNKKFNRSLIARDDFIVTGDFDIFCNKFEAADAFSGNDPNIKQVKETIRGLHFKILTKSRPVVVDGKEAVERKISDSFVASDCCRLDFIDYKSLSEINKGEVVSDLPKAINKNYSKLRIENYPHVLELLGSSYAALQSRGDMQAKFDPESMKKIKSIVSKVLAKGDKHVLNIELKREKQDESYINGYELKELLKLMGVSDVRKLVK